MPYAEKKNTAAIVISFFPDSDFANRIALLCAQFCCVIIVDNTAIENHEFPYYESPVVTIKNKINLGIAAALNLGVSKANDLGFNWVVTFDQDSSILPGFLDELIRIQNFLKSENVVIGSNFFDGSRGKPSYRCRPINDK